LLKNCVKNAIVFLKENITAQVAQYAKNKQKEIVSNHSNKKILIILSFIMLKGVLTEKH